MFGLPTWVIVLVGAIVAYLLYKYWKYKKATKYAPNIAHGTSLDFSTPRDNPTNGT